MSSLKVGRLLLGPPQSWAEQLSDPVASQGGVAIAAQRTAPQFQVALATWAADGSPDTLAARLTLRRQLRALLNNSALKLGGFLYVVYSDDPEQDGWYVPDQGQLSDLQSPVGLATGLWALSEPWYKSGAQRTHREARQVWAKDLRTNAYERDRLGWILSTDFSGLPALALTVLPNGATQASVSVSGAVIAGAPLPAGRDGGACQIVQGLSDLTVVGFERPESALNLSDVIAYDRRGQITAPSAGPDTSWEEFCGADYPYNWQTAGQPNDCPVLDNGLVRIRYDASAGNPGFRVEVWSGSAYVEQGKVTVQRIGDSTGYCNTWVSAGLAEYTPDRAVMRVVLSNSADAYSRELIYITLQRGRLGARFEVYPALKAAGAQADALITYTPNGPDSNDSICFEPSITQPPAAATDQIWASAASTFTSAAGTFSSSTSNYVSLLRCQGGASTVGPYQVNLSVVQQATSFAGASDSSAYGSAQNAVKIRSNSGMGYLQVGITFTSTQADQVQSGTITSWTSTQASKYRVFGYGGATPVFTDYGEYTGSAVSTGSSTRVEAFQTQDRTRAGAIWGGARDQAQAALYDSRTLGALVAR